MDVFGGRCSYRQVCHESIEGHAPDERKEFQADFSLNENPLGCSQKVLDAIRNIERSKIIEYQPVDERLIQKIAEFECVRPDNILVSAGSDTCLQLISTALFNNQARIAYPKPSFPRYEFYIKRMNCRKKPVEFPVFESRNIERFHKSGQDSDAIILDNPSNPTGLRFSQAELEKLVSEKEKPVILDMALSGGTYDIPSLIKKNSFVIKSFSKYFGLPGMRIGYIISAEENIQKLKSLTSPFEIDYVAQKAAKAALEDREHILKSREHVSSEREKIKSELSQLSIKHSDSESTNMVVKLPVEIQEKLIEEGINLTKGKDYKGLPFIKVRIGIRTEEENDLLLNIIREVI
ncbi:MAG: hypothetical protein BRC29_03935 [Nanohaloarchaea archaeon SW_7_43_1]|nr:MAG: hypothetical protein BRC29_03935 [Nanohaloarchaea archaeon SW_7_43_1]